MAFKLDFSCSNKYEAYLTGLAIAYEMGIEHLRDIGDSNLVICQNLVEFSLEEPSLAPIRTLIKKLEDKFNTFEINHAQRIEEPLCGPPRGALASCIIIKRVENKLLKVCEHTHNIGGRTCLYSRLQWLECFNPI
jgi:hypothetical protein